MQISKKAKKIIMGSNIIKADLMTAFDMTQKSVENWVERDDVRLTTPTAITAIMKNSGLKEIDILKPVEA